MPRKANIPNVTKRTRKGVSYWHLRFTRTGLPETSYSFPCAEYSTEEMRYIAGDLVARYKRFLRGAKPPGGWDPWSRQLPGTEPVRPGTLLSDLTQAFTTERRTLGKREQKGGWTHDTYLTYVSILDRLSTSIGPAPDLSDLTTEAITDYIFRPTLSNSTQRSYYRHIRAFVRWIAEQGHDAPAMPAPPEKRPPPDKYVTPEQLEAICRVHLRNVETSMARTGRGSNHTREAQLVYPDIWWFMLYQGLRLREVANARVSWVNFDARTLQVGDQYFTPKGKKILLTPLTKPARVIAAKYAEGRAYSDYLFPVRAYKILSASFTEASREAYPSEGLTIKHLRDGALMYWKGGGAGLEFLRDLLRHSSISTTEEHYEALNIQLNNRVFDEAYERLTGD